jgi:hypothetical protein
VVAKGRVYDGCLISPAVVTRNRAEHAGFSSLSNGLFGRTRHFRSTGNAALDADLDRALQIVAGLFEVRPAFGFYDPADAKYGADDAERNLMNAWASGERTDIAGTWGTVAFGWDLFQNEFRHDPTGVSIITIAAHEFAHVWQYRSGSILRLHTGFPRKAEINADYLAGYYLGSRKLKISNLSFKPAGELLQRLGRSAEGNPQRTHGTAKERLEAAEAGFRAAFVDRKSMSYAFSAGLEYVGA